MVEGDQGNRTDLTSSIDGRSVEGVRAACDDAGITKQTGARWQTIATLPEDRFEAHIAETKDAADVGGVSCSKRSSGNVAMVCHFCPVRLSIPAFL